MERLIDVIARLHELDEMAVICVRRPFLPEADAIVAQPDSSLRIPEEILKLGGYEYFLERSVALEVLEALPRRVDLLKNRVNLLIHYAEFDAYPDWIG